jgi:hypothetical protein
MQFFSVEWLEDGQISLEAEDGTITQGDPVEILSPLQQGNPQAPRQDGPGGIEGVC